MRSVEPACRQLRLPTLAAPFERLAQEATKSNQTHVRYLCELLSVELDEPERPTIGRRIKASRLPRLKTLDEFDFAATPRVPIRLVRELSDRGYLKAADVPIS